MSLEALLAGRSPGESAFLLGTPGELEGLFGSPLPALPPVEVGPDGRGWISYEIAPRVLDGFSRWLGSAERSIGAGAVPVPGSADDALERESLESLSELCRNVLAADRRQGIYNLLWIALGGEVARLLQRHLAAPGRSPGLRHRLYPLVAGLLRRADDSARVGVSRAQRILVDFRRGADAGDAIVRSILDDQLPLLEPDPRAFAASRVLVPENRRFAISAPAFDEITRILRERLRAAFTRRGGALGDLLRAASGGREPGEGDPDGELSRFVFADAVREHLLRDLDGVGADLRRSRTLAAAAAAGSWSALLAAYAELTRCLRRADVIALCRRGMRQETQSLERPETRRRHLEGRLLRLTPDGRVQGGLRTAAMLFADIRGFTRAAEGLVSEGELARELYEVFDPAALIVRRFGGRVDKYLGDGFMATFVGDPPGAAIAAVRAAVTLQTALGRLRERGRTRFRMGIGLHAGRVSLARFFRDGREVDETVIGRQVNVAGRLSEFGDRHHPETDDDAEEGEPGGRTLGKVTLRASGRLQNEGIAASGPLVEALGASITLERFREGDVEGRRWYDRELCLWLHLGYLGEARIRGVEAALPVYALVPTGPAAG